MKTYFAILLLMGALPATLLAQSSNGYVFFAPGGASCCGNTSMTVHFGGGGEAVLWKGIGAGAELGALAFRQDFTDSLVGLLSLNGYYHFVHEKNRKADPFVTAGYSLMFRSGHANLFNFGGGLNYWLDRRLRLRLEFRDHVRSVGALDLGGDIHYWGVRFGLTFR